MARLDDCPTRPRPLATYIRPPAMTATWIALVGLATGFYCAPRGTESQPSMDDMVGFGCSLTIAGTVASMIAFGIGGRPRWAIELALSVLLVGVILALLLGYFLWFDPTLARRQMNLWQFQRVQAGARHWVEQIAGYHGPLGAGAGIVVGAVAGLLTVLGRRMPRLAIGAALAFLFAFSSGFGRQLVLDQMTWWGWKLRYTFIPHSFSDDQISITAMILGAITGAVIAGVAMYATRGAKPETGKG
jgi:hypothetical protein